MQLPVTDNLPPSGSRKTHPAFNVCDGQCQRSTPNIEYVDLKPVGHETYRKVALSPDKLIGLFT